MNFSRFDPKNLFPKLFKFGWYQWRLEGSSVVNFKLENTLEPGIYNPVSNLFENFFDFEFKAKNPKSWEMELPSKILNKIGGKP